MCTNADGVEVNNNECGYSSPRREERTCDMGSCTSGWYFTEWPTQVGNMFEYMGTNIVNINNKRL